MIAKDQRLVRMGVLGCGPVAQAAHLEACRKARNTLLYAICDVADERRERMAAVHQPEVAYADYRSLLADERVDAVIVAVADAFHVDAALAALDAGKHVLVEKPLGTNLESCRMLRARAAAQTNLVVQVGNNRRFDPGVAFAQRFLNEELGPRIALKAWYHDSVYRYTMTDNLQPVPVFSGQALLPDGEPKADRRRYLLFAHGSHLLDTARFLGGPLIAIRARHLERSDSHCWFIDVDFADGSLGHLDLHVPIRGDFQEGFEIQGEYGSVSGRLPLSWYHKSSEVECFSARTRQFHRVLGEDAHTYRRQLESFAASILDGVPQLGATLDDGLAAVQALVAIARSCENGEKIRLDSVSGAV
jgi:predicted dehydrogenase